MSKILLFFIFFPTIYKCKKLTNIQKQMVGQIWLMGCILLTSTLEYLIKIFLKFSIVVDQMYIPIFTLRPSQRYLSRLSPPNSKVFLGLPASDGMVFGRRSIDQICDGIYFLLGIDWSATHLAAGFQLIM